MRLPTHGCVWGFPGSSSGQEEPEGIRGVYSKIYNLCHRETQGQPSQAPLVGALSCCWDLPPHPWVLPTPCACTLEV